MLYSDLLYWLLFAVIIRRSDGVDKEVEGEDRGGGGEGEEGEEEEGAIGRDQEG